jgi:membrane fusion protein (multidrug efflux system)
MAQDLDSLTPVPVPFRSTLRSLRSADEREQRALTLLALGGAAAWAIWSLAATIPLYATANGARVEAERSTFQIAARVDGTITRADLEIGQAVAMGQVLLELDPTAQRMAHAEGGAAIDGLLRDLTALDNRAKGEARAAAADQARLALAVEEAAASEREARADSDRSARRASDVARLLSAGLVAESEAVAARQEADGKRARWEASRLAEQRAGKAREVSAAEAAAKSAATEAERVRLQGQLAVAERRLEQLAHDVELRRVVAPAAGTIGDLGNVYVGTFVEAGERLGVLVPDDALRIVADLPGEMLAKVRPGQPARFRFEGYPALAHGSIAAVVTRVGADAHDGSVEVILAPRHDAAARLPLQHGVRGTVDIEVERLTPAALLRRKAAERAEPPPAAVR